MKLLSIFYHHENIDELNQAIHTRGQSPLKHFHVWEAFRTKSIIKFRFFLPEKNMNYVKILNNFMSDIHSLFFEKIETF